MEVQNRKRKIKMKVLSKDPEVRAHIFQQIIEFHPYITAKTLIEVIAQDRDEAIPSDAHSDRNGSGNDKMHYILIRLTEGGSKLEAEGCGDDLFSAIRAAKEAMLRELEKIHDEIMSNSERHQIINSILANNQTH